MVRLRFRRFDPNWIFHQQLPFHRLVQRHVEIDVDVPDGVLGQIRDIVFLPQDVAVVLEVPLLFEAEEEILDLLRRQLLQQLLTQVGDDMVPETPLHHGAGGKGIALLFVILQPLLST